MDEEIRTIPYFLVYVADFKALRHKLSNDEIIEILDAISDLCLYGETDYIPQNRFQQVWFEKLQTSFIKNLAKYKTCVENGKKGGRPPKTQEKPNGFVSVIANENPDETQEKPNKNKNKNKNSNNNKNKIDIYTNSYKDFFIKTYKEIFKSNPFLSILDCRKIVELSTQYEPNIIQTAIEKLSKIKFDDIDFKPSASWLLKENNFERVMNGEFDKHIVSEEIEFKY